MPSGLTVVPASACQPTIVGVSSPPPYGTIRSLGSIADAIRCATACAGTAPFGPRPATAELINSTVAATTANLRRESAAMTHEIVPKPFPDPANLS